MRKLSGIMVISISVIVIMSLILTGCGGGSSSTTTSSAPPTSTTSQPTTNAPTSTTSQPTTNAPTSTTSQPTTSKPSTTTTAAGQPITLGLMTSISGFFSSMAPYMTTGAQMAVDDANKAGGILGRQVKLDIRDDMGDPSQVPQAATAFQSEGAVGIVGSFLDACHAALQAWAGANKMLVAAPSDTVITNRTTNFNKYVFFQGVLSTIYGTVFADQIAKQNDVNKVYFLGSDVSMVHWIHDSFWAEMQKIKPSVQDVGDIFAGSQETDYQSILTACLAKKPDMTLVLIGGPSWPPFAAAASNFGFFDKTKVAGALNLDGYAEAGFGKNYPLGLQFEFTAPYWLDTPAMSAFTTDFNTRTKLWPSELTAEYYLSAWAMLQSIQKAGTTDTDKVIAAWETLTLPDTCLGTISYNDYDHQGNFPMWYGVSGYGDKFPLAVGLNMVKINTDSLYPTRDQVLAARAGK
jgi:branched-chain amino acid transport system substrate-binding protein